VETINLCRGLPLHFIEGLVNLNPPISQQAQS